jgi:flagellar biosynthesis regulator FlaF
MATIRQSASSSIISMLSTVNASASTVAKTINATADSVDMLTAYITKAKAEQTKTHIIEAKNFDDNLIQEASLAKSKREAALEKELRADQRLAQLYQQNHAEYTALLFPQQS